MHVFHSTGRLVMSEDREEYVVNERAQQAPLSEAARWLREEALGLEKRTRNLMRHNMFDNPQSYFGQHDEVRAQLTLAVRALEDARMRLGKALQYAGDGVSIYDRM